MRNTPQPHVEGCFFYYKILLFHYKMPFGSFFVRGVAIPLFKGFYKVFLSVFVFLMLR